MNYFHITKKSNLKSILEHGLQAKCSGEDGDLCISLFTTKKDALKQTFLWLSKKLDHAPLVILTINCKGLKLTETFPWELITTDKNPILKDRILSIKDLECPYLKNGIGSIKKSKNKF